MRPRFRLRRAGPSERHGHQRTGHQVRKAPRNAAAFDDPRGAAPMVPDDEEVPPRGGRHDLGDRLAAPHDETRKLRRETLSFLALTWAASCASRLTSRLAGESGTGTNSPFEVLSSLMGRRWFMRLRIAARV